MTKRTPQPKLKHPIDISLGAQIRLVRKRKDPPFRQEWLAEGISCSPQQVQKYESGENRIAVSTLCEMAKVLDVSVMDLLGPVLLENNCR